MSEKKTNMWALKDFGREEEVLQRRLTAGDTPFLFTVMALIYPSCNNLILAHMLAKLWENLIPAAGIRLSASVRKAFSLSISPAKLHGGLAVWAPQPHLGVCMRHTVCLGGGGGWCRKVQSVNLWGMWDSLLPEDHRQLHLIFMDLLREREEVEKCSGISCT